MDWAARKREGVAGQTDQYRYILSKAVTSSQTADYPRSVRVLMVNGHLSSSIDGRNDRSVSRGLRIMRSEQRSDQECSTCYDCDQQVGDFQRGEGVEVSLFVAQKTASLTYNIPVIKDYTFSLEFPFLRSFPHFLRDEGVFSLFHTYLLNSASSPVVRVVFRSQIAQLCSERSAECAFDGFGPRSSASLAITRPPHDKSGAVPRPTDVQHPAGL